MNTLHVIRLKGIGYAMAGSLFRTLNDVESHVQDFYPDHDLHVSTADEHTLAFWTRAQHNGTANYWGTTKADRARING